MANPQLTIASGGKTVTLELTRTSLHCKYHGKKGNNIAIDARYIISAISRLFEESTFVEVYFLAKKRKNASFSLEKIEGTMGGGDSAIAAEWVDQVMALAYEGVKRNKKLKVLVNPHSGQGKSRSIFNKTVEPIFRAANCSLDATYTTHSKHAYEIAKDLSLDYDAIVTLSGDGLIHEVLNGFAIHKEPRRALGIPMAPIPTGSGNALSLNLLGIKDGFDPAVAALNVIKGQPLKVDLFSIIQKGKRTFSFMSQAMGLMADLDIGTENLRWMGDLRFILGLFRGVIPFNSCPIQLSIKVVESDKHAMVKALASRPETPSSIPQNGPNFSLPPLRYLPEDKEGWITIDKPILYLYAGQGPYVGRDYMAFPVSLPDDGLIDIVAQEVSSRTEIIKSMSSAQTGQTFWHNSQHYFKADAYRVKPLSGKGCFAVDGEEYPFEEYQVEVHRGLGTFLSLYGRYAVDFQSTGKDI